MDIARFRQHDPPMLVWLKHQYAVYAYGAGLLMLFAVFALGAATMGALVLYLASVVFDYEAGKLDWLLASLVCAPFGLPTLAGMVADLVRENPPPSDIDLYRAKNGLPPRGK